VPTLSEEYFIANLLSDFALENRPSSLAVNSLAIIIESSCSYAVLIIPEINRLKL